MAPETERKDLQNMNDGPSMVYWVQLDNGTSVTGPDSYPPDDAPPQQAMYWQPV